MTSPVYRCFCNGGCRKYNEQANTRSNGPQGGKESNEQAGDEKNYMYKIREVIPEKLRIKIFSFFSSRGILNQTAQSKYADPGKGQQRIAQPLVSFDS